MSALLTLTLALAAPAHAAQSSSAGDFANTYNLVCEDAALVVHAAIAGELGDASGGWSDAITVALDCDGIDADEALALAEELAAGCESGGLSADLCESVATDVAAGIAEVNDGAVGLLPNRMTTTVNTWNWFSRLSGWYWMNASHAFPDGSAASWGYLLNNNDGGNHGNFATIGAALGASGAIEGLACAETGFAVVAGNIDHDADLALSADAGVDRSLTCLAVVGTDWIAANIGIALDATLSGAPE